MAQPPEIELDEVDRWCGRVLGSPVAEPILHEGYLSIVQALRLLDGREVVVKIRAAAERLYGCLQTQRHLFRAGFPCPEPLSALVPSVTAGSLRQSHTSQADSHYPTPGGIYISSPPPSHV